MRPVLIEHVQIAELVHLRLGPAERDDWPDGKDMEHFRAGGIGQTQVKAKLALEVIGLLQNVLANFRSGIGRAGGLGHSEFLLPQLGAFDDIELPGLAHNFPVPILDSDGRGNRVAPWQGCGKVRRQVHALGGHLGGGQQELARNRGLAGLGDDFPVVRFHRKGEPILLGAQPQGLPGAIRDADRRDERLARQELILVLSDFNRHLGGRRGQRREEETEP